MPEYFNYALCKACGGLCCQKVGGAYIPEDFNEPIAFEFIINLLQTGKFTIDWWEGDVFNRDRAQTWFLRARSVNGPIVCGYHDYLGTCVNWTPQRGCDLPEKERPYQCRKLIPGVTDGRYKCIPDPADQADKEGIAKAWYPYQAILDAVVDRYT